LLKKNCELEFCLLIFVLVDKFEGGFDC